MLRSPHKLIKYFVFSSLLWIGSSSFTFPGAGVFSERSGSDTSISSPGQQLFLADPTIYYEKGRYYLYGTHAVNNGFEVYISTNLKDWHKKEDLALSKKDVYGDKGFWAPQVFKFKKKYYMAYTANEHIAIAVSNSPLGPFKQKDKKPITDPEGLKDIDPFVFIDKENRVYLYYVRLKQGNRIYMAEMQDDLTDIKTGTVTSCVNAVDHPQKWENVDHNSWSVTEGPTVIKHHGYYYLFYSGNGFGSPYYAVGYAVAQKPTGPWKKYDGNPILNKSTIKENGPGHGDFFKDPSGKYYYVFHTHFSDRQVKPRKTALIKGSFISDKKGPDVMRFDADSFTFFKHF